MTRTTRIAGMTLALALTASACGGGPSAEVALEAAWQCDVQRMAFESLDKMDEELQERLAEANMTAEDYAKFKEELSTSPDLRDQVSAEYDAYCTG